LTRLATISLKALHLNHRKAFRVVNLTPDDDLLRFSPMTASNKAAIFRNCAVLDVNTDEAKGDFLFPYG
jgi:hypothetical protein